MEEQFLFNLGVETPPTPDDDGGPVVQVKPNLWLLTSEEIPPLLFTPEAAGKCLGVGRHKVFDLVRQGALRSVKVGGSRRISARALADYVAAMEAGEPV